jgi:hypothetical protein
MALLLMIITSTFLWYLQPPASNATDADDFSSIPATFYLAARPVAYFFG